MIAKLILWNYLSPTGFKKLKNTKWMYSNGCFIAGKISIDDFYEITNIHIPTVYAIYDKARARTGYSPKNIRFEHYLTYTKTKSGFVLQAVVTKNDKKIINIKTPSTNWDFLELYI